MVRIVSSSGTFIGSVNIFDWRCIFVEEGYLNVCLADFTSIVLYDLTLEKFNALNYIGIDGTLVGEVDGVFLMCKKCKGTGRIDWISNVVGQNRRVNSKSYYRNPYASVIVIEGNRFYSKPHLTAEEEEYCSECEGSGLYNERVYKSYGYKEITFDKS